MKRILALAMILASLAAPARAQAPAGDLYSLITQQHGWLNTSRPLTPADLQGRMILLDFWTYGCINCMHVIPELDDLEKKYGADLTIIGVHSAKFKNESDTKNISGAILRFGIDHPVVNDFDFSTWNAFGVRAWPTLILIGPNGTIQSTYSGEGHHDDLEKDIDSLRARYAGHITHSPLPIALERDKQKQTMLSFPSKMAVAMDGDKPVLFIADNGHRRIIAMTLDGAIIDTIGSGHTSHDDGDFATASFSIIQGLAYQNHILYIADTNNHRLRAADLVSRKVTTIAGNGAQGNDRAIDNAPALATSLSSPWDIAFYPDNTHLAIAMAGLHQIWSYDIVAKTLSVIAGNGNESIEDGHWPHNALAQTSGLSAYDGKLYFVDAESSSLRVLENATVTTLIGHGLFDFGYKDGTKEVAQLQHPLGIVAGKDVLYIADAYNHSIRAYTIKTGMLSTFAGHGVRGKTDGDAHMAEFNEPSAVLQIGETLYVADTNNSAIRTVDIKTGKVATLTIKPISAN